MKRIISLLALNLLLNGCVAVPKNDDFYRNINNNFSESNRLTEYQSKKLSKSLDGLESFIKQTTNEPLSEVKRSGSLQTLKKNIDTIYIKNGADYSQLQGIRLTNDGFYLTVGHGIKSSKISGKVVLDYSYQIKKNKTIKSAITEEIDETKICVMPELDIVLFKAKSEKVPGAIKDYRLNISYLKKNEFLKTYSNNGKNTMIPLALNEHLSSVKTTYGTTAYKVFTSRTVNGSKINIGDSGIPIFNRNYTEIVGMLMGTEKNNDNLSFSIESEMIYYNLQMCNNIFREKLDKKETNWSVEVIYNQ